jgi:hypothetical protein
VQEAKDRGNTLVQQNDHFIERSAVASVITTPIDITKRPDVRWSPLDARIELPEQRVSIYAQSNSY